MLSKKRIVILAAVLVVSFGLSFLLSLWLGPRPAPAAGAAMQPVAAGAGGPPPEVAILLPGPDAVKIAPRELQLNELVKELQFERQRLRTKAEELAKREKQIEMVMEDLNRSAEELETLRLKLLGPLNGLKEARVELEQTRVRIRLEEMANLKKMAKSYDVMDADGGGKILAEMCSGGQEDDAVKLLYYMKERSAAKILSALTDQALAARLTEKLKRITKEG
ncbi:MAG TPA: hypothetical protein VFJ30_02610 [Phycisphaerae bacterium]|nr:hypothetical protein [Phycisphaerae bacterium]